MQPRKKACVSVWRMLRVSCASLAVAAAREAASRMAVVLSPSAGTSLISLMERGDMHLSTTISTTSETAAVRQIRRPPTRIADGFRRTSCTTRTLYPCLFEISPAVSLTCGRFSPVQCTSSHVCLQVSILLIFVGKEKNISTNFTITSHVYSLFTLSQIADQIASNS